MSTERIKSMSKIRIDANERYPDYSVVSGRYGLEVEADEEQVARWDKAAHDYSVAQDEMGELYEAAAAAEAERAARKKAEREAAEKAERARLAREREREAKARQAKEAAMWERIQASGGVVYDADGKRIGKVQDGGYSGIRLDP